MSSSSYLDGFALAADDMVLAETHKTLVVAGTLRIEIDSVDVVLNVAGKTWQYGTRPTLKAMQAELRVMQQLGPHDCILRGFGIAETGHRQWLVMARWRWSAEAVLLGRVPGVTLEGSIRRLEVLVDVGNGLAHMHSMHLLHRDLALRNIMLRPKEPAKNHLDDAVDLDEHGASSSGSGSNSGSNSNGNGDGDGNGNSNRFAACLCDFGLSVAVSPASSVGVYRPVSSSVSLHGPTRSMAPEVLSTDTDAGFPVYSTASDVWGFGVCIWSMLVQQQPYSDVSSKHDVVRRHVLEDGGRLAAVSSYRSSSTGVVGEYDQAALAVLDLLLASCFATDPAERPAAATVTRKLELLLEQQRELRNC